MDTKMNQKKVISIQLTLIDLMNIKSGEAIKARVKTNFETEVPYEVVVSLDGKENQDYTE